LQLGPRGPNWPRSWNFHLRFDAPAGTGFVTSLSGSRAICVLVKGRAKPLDSRPKGSARDPGNLPRSRSQMKVQLTAASELFGRPPPGQATKSKTLRPSAGAGNPLPGPDGSSASDAPALAREARELLRSQDTSPSNSGPWAARGFSWCGLPFRTSRTVGTSRSVCAPWSPWTVDPFLVEPFLVEHRSDHPLAPARPSSADNVLPTHRAHRPP
jgi:hypothetical protein